MNKQIEELSEQIHHVYCEYYKKRHGKEYWTKGDYSKLDEQTKEADRHMARFIRTLLEKEKVVRFEEVFLLREHKKEVLAKCAAELEEVYGAVDCPDTEFNNINNLIERWRKG